MFGGDGLPIHFPGEERVRIQGLLNGDATGYWDLGRVATEVGVLLGL